VRFLYASGLRKYKVASFHRKAIGVNDFSFNVINDAEQAHSKEQI
jgi:hypothetical protein